jgi:hypothetical protein
MDGNGIVISKEVKRGAAFLDEKRPGWEFEINTRRLDIASHCSCLLGQLYGSYVRGVKSCAPNGLFGFNPIWAVRHGFLALNGAEGFRSLSHQWTLLITQRLAQLELEPASMLTNV